MSANMLNRLINFTFSIANPLFSLVMGWRMTCAMTENAAKYICFLVNELSFTTTVHFCNTLQEISH